jgi:hypothetical protein
MSVHVPRDEPELDGATLDAIAARLAERLLPRVVEMMRAVDVPSRATQPRSWLNATEVAQQLKVTREWVYEHASDLGAVRIGDGPRPRLRFPPNTVSLDTKPPRRPRATEERRSNKGKRGLIAVYDG